MSILIKDMEMPTSCANCELAKHFDGYNENDCPFNAFSYYDCPLIPIPDETESAKHAYMLTDEDGNIECSNCGSGECWGNYCMNCGARMDGMYRKEYIVEE